MRFTRHLYWGVDDTIDETEWVLLLFLYFHETLRMISFEFGVVRLTISWTE